MKQPPITKLHFPELMNIAFKLTAVGRLTMSDNKLVYLDIDDAYINQLFPLLKNHPAKKPDYFGEHSAGAHITVIYPEENKIINKEDLGEDHHFLIKEVVAAKIGLKTYYVLLLSAPSLLQLRRKYALSDKLCFKGYAIDFHITIGVNQ